MNKIRMFFNKHPKLSYLGNFIVTCLCTTVFIPSFTGFLIGVIVGAITINVLGLEWKPLRNLKNKEY